jgi:hypothetical protein
MPLNTCWQQHEPGVIQGLIPGQASRKSDPQAAQRARLRRMTEQLKAQLECAALITPHLPVGADIDMQKIVSQMLSFSSTWSAEPLVPTLRAGHGPSYRTCLAARATVPVVLRAHLTHAAG